MNWDFLFAAVGALLFGLGFITALVTAVEGEHKSSNYVAAISLCLAGLFIASFGVS